MNIVVFDLGNVLADHEGKVAALAEIWGVDAEALDAPYWAHRQPYDEGCDDLIYFGAIANDLNLPMSAELATELGAADAANWAQIRPTARQLLIDLCASGVKTAILSNAPRAMAAAIEASNWRHFVGPVVVSGVVGETKPNPAIYDLVEQAVGAKGRELLFIDDRPDNVRGAELNGWRAHLWTDDDDTRRWLVDVDVLNQTPPQYVDPTLADLAVSPGQVDLDSLSGPDRFSALACLRYDQLDAPPLRAQAAELLASQPELVDGDIWAAAAAADLSAVTRLLDRDATLVSRRGGPYNWEPLIYLCYSRVQGAGAVSVAAALLDAGADPNAGYLWDGSYLFTALTGVFGEGEQGNRRQPRHRGAEALATLLLQRGAHPFDHQTLYNRMFGEDDSHLELLFAHGLATCGPSPWEERMGPRLETREQAWQRQVEWAATHGFGGRLSLLASHGIDTSGVTLVPRSFPTDLNATDHNGATALHRAAWDGDLELVRQLLAAGADTSITDARFQATALGWAEHGYQTEVAELIRQATS